MEIETTNIINVIGSAIEPHWQYPVQIVATKMGGLYINTPQISKMTYRESMKYSVGEGNLYGKTGTKYRTISPK